MTITTTVNRYSYSGNGSTTAFAYSSKFLANADLVVVLITAAGVETVKTLTTHYTVTGAGAAGGGTVTMVTAPSATETLVIYGDPTITQSVDLVDGDNLAPGSQIEDPIDRLTLIGQRLDARVDRALRQPEHDVAAIFPFPIRATRLGKYLAFDAAGDPSASAGTGNDTALRTDLAASGGSALSGFIASGAGAVARSAQAKMREHPSISDFGAVGDGLTDDSAAFQAAIDASAGYALRAVGTFLLVTPINLSANTTYDFRGATFIPGSGCNGLGVIRAMSVDNVEILGGYVKFLDGTTPEITHSTGDYGNCAPYYFLNCNGVTLLGARGLRFYGFVDVYNCRDVLVGYCRGIDMAGGIQAIADSGSTGDANVRGIQFANNQIIRSGDDSFSLQVLGTGTLRASTIANNWMTKTTRGNGELATVGASGIRLESAVAGAISGCKVLGNIGRDMVSQFIIVHGTHQCTIADNAVDGYAKASFNEAYYFGSGAGILGNTYGTFRNNVARNPGVNTRGILLDGADYCTVEDNRVDVTNPSGGNAIYVYRVTNSIIRENQAYNQGSGYGIHADALSSGNLIEDNDVSDTGSIGIFDQGTNNTLHRNRGFVTENQGTASITSGNTTVTVNHGLGDGAGQPAAARIKVTAVPTTTWGNTTKWWIDNIGNSSFRLNADIDPAATLSFYWRVETI